MGDPAAALTQDTVIQICFVTHDVEASARWFSGLTGKPMPQMSFAADPQKASADYRGQPASVTCRIMMFHFGNIDLEFLEPGPEPSVWRELLEHKGPGCHHIAFRTRNMTQQGNTLEAHGHAKIQSGEFQSGTGRYAYFDTMSDLGAFIELLEFDNDKDVP